MDSLKPTQLQSMKIVGCIVLSLMALLGCGKSPPTMTSSGVGFNSETADRPTDGPISKEVKSILHARLAEQCDFSQKQMMIEIGGALDAHSAEITDLVKKQNADQTKKELVPFHGDFLVVSPSATPSDQPLKSKIKSWTSLYEDYRKIQDSPVDEKWVALNTSVRGMLFDDSNRVKAGVNFYIEPTDLLQLKKLGQITEDCLNDLTCFNLKLDEATLSLLKSNPLFKPYWIEIHRAKTDLDRKKQIKSFYENRLEHDWMRHSFIANPLLTLKKTADHTTYVLPFDRTDLSEDDQKLVKSTVESLWKSDRAQVTLEFKEAAKDLYKILFSAVPGNRASTQDATRSISLYAYNSTRAIAHEMGHVIGFSDHYYTVWNQNECSYTISGDERDLMSITQTGTVTDAEWKDLEEGLK